MDSEINTVSLKLTIFWRTQHEVWFAQAQAQFAIRKISEDSTKYYYVVSSLEQDTASQILEIITKPPEKGKYELLKERLLKIFGLSKRERASKLLDLSGLGDKKPSILLAEMRALAGGHTTCPLFEGLFLRKLPTDIRMQLSQVEFYDLNKVGEYPDSIWQARSQHIELDALNLSKNNIKKQF